MYSSEKACIFANMEMNDINLLVSENLNYVKAVANQYRGHGVEFDDLVGEGYLAMMQAAQKFDSSRGTNFVAYAAPFIRKAMEKMLPQTQNKVQKSIDAPLSATNQYTLLDILNDKDAEQADDNTILKMVRNDLLNALNALDARDKEVIMRFYGIGTPHLTMIEIAEQMDLKRERVRQIRDKAIRKIAKNAHTKALKAFLKK